MSGGKSLARKTPLRASSAPIGFAALSLLLLVFFAIVGASGCTPRRSGGDTPGGASTSQPRPLEVVEKAHWRDQDGEEYLIVIRNPNHDFGVATATVTVRLSDSAGNVYQTDHTDLFVIRPDETVYAWGTNFEWQEPASIDVEVKVAESQWIAKERWEPDQLRPLEVSDFRVRESTGAPDPYLVGAVRGHSYFTGTVVNPNSVTFSYYDIWVVQRTAEGRIIGMSMLGLRGLPKNGHSDFVMDVRERLPVDRKFEVFAKPLYFADGGDRPFR